MPAKVRRGDFSGLDSILELPSLPGGRFAQLSCGINPQICTPKTAVFNPFPLFMSLLLIGFGLELLDGTLQIFAEQFSWNAMPELACFSAGCRE